MKKQIDIWKGIFIFNKKERWGGVFLLLIFTFLSASVWLYQKEKRVPKEDAVLDSLAIAIKADTSFFTRHEIQSGNKHTMLEAKHLFVFNPNTLDEDGWLRLGLSPKLVATIMNYRSKGGYFRHKEDIRKIWGLQKQDADMLIPYITINEQYKQTHTFDKKTKPALVSIDVNLATEAEWQKLPAIGKVLSARIVKYRTARKGFQKIDDVKKVYGISDSVFAIIHPYLTITAVDATSTVENVKTSPVVLLNINTATEKEMIQSQKIPHNVAKAIVLYREQKGAYASIDEVKNIVFINDVLFEKIKPYITVK